MIVYVKIFLRLIKGFDDIGMRVRDHNALRQQALDLGHALGSMDGSAHGSNVARHGDEGLAAQAAAETNVHQVDISRLHGCIGCDNGCAEAVGLHNADGSDLADLVAGVDGAGHLSCTWEITMLSIRR